VTPEQGCIVLDQRHQWTVQLHAPRSGVGKTSVMPPFAWVDVLVLVAAAQLAGAKQEDHGPTPSSKLCVLTPIDNNEELWSFE
jgi:hypothetical protein